MSFICCRKGIDNYELFMSKCGDYMGTSDPMKKIIGFGLDNEECYE